MCRRVSAVEGSNKGDSPRRNWWVFCVLYVLYLRNHKELCYIKDTCCSVIVSIFRDPEHEPRPQ